MNTLFPEDFLAAISQLTLLIKSAPPRVPHGEQQSALAGASLEFRDFRGYVAGDDLRRVDWNIYQRTRHLFLRRFDHPTTVPIQVLLDGSASMFLETPGTRFATGARLVAAIASAAINSQDTVNVAVLGSDGQPARAVSNRQQFVDLLERLSRQQAGGRSGLSSIHQLLPRLGMARGRGVLVIVSDFFESDGVEAIIQALRGLPHRLVLLKIMQPWDEKPELLEDTELLDCESDARLMAMPGQETYRRYLETYHGYFETLSTYAHARGASMTNFDAQKDTVVQLQGLFHQGVLEL